MPTLPRHLPTLLRHLSVVTLLATQLCACGILQRLPLLPSREQQVEETQDWRAKGKLNVVYQNQSNSAYFDWQNRGRDFTIHLHGPLGQGSVYLKKTDNRYSLQDGEQEYSEPSAEALLYSQLGLKFPVSDLIYWIRGIPAPGDNATRSAPHTLRQKGWTIEYLRENLHQGHLLPEKLVATRREVKLTVIIKHWEMPP